MMTVNRIKHGHGVGVLFGVFYVMDTNGSESPTFAGDREKFIVRNRRWQMKFGAKFVHRNTRWRQEEILQR